MQRGRQAVVMHDVICLLRPRDGGRRRNMVMCVRVCDVWTHVTAFDRRQPHPVYALQVTF